MKTRTREVLIKVDDRMSRKLQHLGRSLPKVIAKAMAAERERIMLAFEGKEADDD